MPLLPSRYLRSRFDLYLNEVERERVASAAQQAHLPMSTYVRRAALKLRIQTPPSEVTTTQWAELARTTANLNQLAHAINTGRVNRIDLTVLESVRDEVRKLRLNLLSGGSSVDCEDH